MELFSRRDASIEEAWKAAVGRHEAFIDQCGFPRAGIDSWDALSLAFQEKGMTSDAIECSLRALELYIEANDLDYIEFRLARDLVAAIANGVPPCGKLLDAGTRRSDPHCRLERGEPCQHVTFRGKPVCVECGMLDLNCQGITRIGEIEGLYTVDKLRVLSLPGNYIRKIEGLENLVELRSLVLSHNLLSRIEGLDHLPRLEFLELSHNWIARIEGLDAQQAVEYLGLDLTLIRDTSGVDRLRSLTVLSVRGNDLRRLVGLHALPRLEEVRVDGTWGEGPGCYGGITDGKLASIRKAKDFCRYMDDERRSRLQRARSMLAVSDLVPSDLIKQVLQMSDREYNDRIVEWCEQFGFRLRGYAIDTADGDAHAFLDWLDEHYYFWTDFSVI